MKKIEKRRDGFYQPIVVDDWGNVGYYLSAVKSDAGTWGHREQDQTLRLKKGEILRVRWPDGRETEEELVAEPYSVEIPDMGTTYRTSGERLKIVTELRGLKVEVPLQDLWVKRPEPVDLVKEVERLRMALQAVADVHPETGISRIKAFARTALLNAKQRYDLKKEGT